MTCLTLWADPLFARLFNAQAFDVVETRAEFTTDTLPITVTDPAKCIRFHTLPKQTNCLHQCKCTNLYRFPIILLYTHSLMDFNKRVKTRHRNMPECFLNTDLSGTYDQEVKY